MKTRRVEVNKIDLRGLIEESIKHFQMISGVMEYVLPHVNREKNKVEYLGEPEGRNIVNELLNGEKSLYFIFAGPGEDESVSSVGGSRIINVGDEEDFFSLGYADTVGFVITVDDDVAIIESGINSGETIPFPRFEFDEDLGRFDVGIELYVERFII